MPANITAKTTELKGVIELHAPIELDEGGFDQIIFDVNTWAGAALPHEFVQDNILCS